MMNRITLRLAASTMIIGLTMVSCGPSGDGYRLMASHKPAKAERKANVIFRQAEAAVVKQDFAGALTLAEQAVELSPRDVGYRMLLADLYLKQGRFTSAETSFQDVLSLNPGNVRASLNLAMVRTALGKTGEALASLEAVASTAAPGDLGLAYALAGQPARAIEMLEPAARAEGANARVRQNLALAYALAGDWKKAQTTAAQDLSPAAVGARMQHWASFAQPEAAQTRIASLLGVTQVEDAGQPVRLALAPEAAPAQAFVAAEPVPAPAAEVVPAPVQTAAVESAPVPVETVPVEIAAAEPAAEPVVFALAPSTAAVEPEVQPVYAAAVQSLVEPSPEAVRAVAPKPRKPLPTFAAVRKPAPKARNGRFVVQLGAFSTAGAVEKGWTHAQRRYASVSGLEPVSTTVSIPGKGVFHRLAVSGFATHADAARICGSVKAKGGACFVRTLAGDAPVRWASRNTRRG